MFLRMWIEEEMREDLRNIPHQTALGSPGLDLLQDTGVHDGSVTKKKTPKIFSHHIHLQYHYLHLHHVQNCK